MTDIVHITPREIALERENERYLKTINIQAVTIEVMQAEIAASERNLEQLTDDLVRSRVELAALKAQPVQEPVTHQFQSREGKWCLFLDEAHRVNTISDGTWPIRALYAAPVQPAPLTDEQIEKLWDDVLIDRDRIYEIRIAFARAIEAAIKGGAT